MDQKRIRFAAVGDVSFGDHPLCAGIGSHSTFNRRSSQFPFQHIKSVLEPNDILFGNLECTLSETGRVPGDYQSTQMRGQPSYVDSLVDARFDVMNLANNHSLQHGERAFTETETLLKEHNILTTGVNKHDHLTGVPTIIDRNGIRIGFLGYSLRPRQYFEKPPLYTEGHSDGIVRDIRNLNHAVDIVVTSVHWGDEFIRRPAPEEIRLGRQMIDAGCDLVIGHHPHVLRGVESYNGGHIAYSLGNFLCDMIWDESLRESAVLECELSKNGVHDLKLTPCYINDQFQPTVMEASRAEFLLKRIAEMSQAIENDSQLQIQFQSKKYAQDADAVLQQIRRKSQMFFLRNLWKYPPSILFQQIGKYFKNRASEISDKSTADS